MSRQSPLLRAADPQAIPEVDFARSFLAAAAAHPDKIAVIDESGAQNWAEFSSLATAVAGRLRRDGLGQGQRVAALAENSARYLAVYAGIVLAGACVVPLPVGADPRTLRKMIQDSAAALLFASGAQLDRARSLGCARVIDLADLADWAHGCRLEAPIPVSRHSYFDLIYSSGTTGSPKGIIHDHLFRNRQLERMPRFGLDGDARLLMSTPLYSNTTLVAALPVLAKGGTIVSMAKFDTSRFLQLSQRHRITHAMLVPVQYMRLMDAPDFDSFDLSAYRAKMSTSAPLPAPLKRQLLQRWPGDLYEVYGMTEGGVSTVLDCAAHPDKLETVGQPAEGCDARIIDARGRQMPQGDFGEIVGRSGAMMQGYLNAADKTREVLWTSPEGLDFIRTGDMGRFDADGFLHLLDRKKDMILSGGFNIYATDIETVLRDHPEVADVAVIAIPSREWGETPLGLVLCKAGAASSADQIRDWANSRLGKTQRLSAVEIRTELPRNAIGKIEKRMLRRPYWEDTKG